MNERGTAVHAADTIHSIVDRATLAPSGRKVQPWRFQLATATIDLLAEWPQLLMRWGDPTDVLPAAPRRPLNAVLEAISA